MLLLAFSLVGGLFLSNYRLKQQSDKIDTSDPYWDYLARESGEFHHVSIIGGNLLRTKNIAGDKNRLMRDEDLKDWLTAEIKNDKLHVDFAKNVPTTRENEAQQLANFEVIITMKELHSLTITIHKSIVELKVPTSDTLKVIARNKSGVDLQEIDAGKLVNILVENNSFFGIYRQNEKRLVPNDLTIRAKHKSSSILNNVSAKAVLLNAVTTQISLLMPDY
jgi:hypothetical protein